MSEGDFGPAQTKPEFDECAALARGAGVPVREVIAAAAHAYADGKFARSYAKPRYPPLPVRPLEP